jgi:pimeloyl-ACP methyl ester carboxylesterase
MSEKVMASVALLVAFCLLSFVACDSSSGSGDSGVGIQEFDAASSDRPHFDSTNPPRLSETSFEIEGVGMNAIVYEAQGLGPHPTVVLLHGFPGNERNLDLAQAIRRVGWNVVFFHYRGAWGSGGQFSFLHVIEDVAVVVDEISEPEFATAHRIDPERIALVGHSMGGFAALVAGAELPEVDCVVSMSGANLGGLARSLENAPEQSASFAASLDRWSGPIRGPSGEQLIEELAAQTDRLDTIAHASALAKKDLLLIAGGRDVVTPAELHHGPLVEALEAAGATSLQTTIFEQADHAYSGRRIALARRVTGWLQTHCARGH